MTKSSNIKKLVGAAVTAGLVGGFALQASAATSPARESHRLRAVTDRLERGVNWPRANASTLASTSVPGARIEHQVAGQSSPAISRQSAEIPRIDTIDCTQSVCGRIDILESKTAVTPQVASQRLAIQDINVPATCARPVACTSTFTVQGRDLASTPNVASRSVSTPALSTPATCRTWPCSGATVGGQRVVLVPDFGSLRLTPPVAIDVAVSELSAATDLRLDQASSTGPANVAVPVPGLGTVKVTLFPDGLNLPGIPGAEFTGTVTLTVSVGSLSYTGRAPLSIVA